MKNTKSDVLESNASVVPTVAIPLELLKNIRNLIEVTNSRIKWKTEELLPVGTIVKQMDELLISDQAK